MRMRLRKLLEASHFEVIEAANGKQAVDLYQEQHPAIVMMDITMPEMDGVTACQTICQADPNAKVVMVSALGQQAMIVSAMQAGAKDFVVKPYEPERILQAISKWT